MDEVLGNHPEVRRDEVMCTGNQTQRETIAVAAAVNSLVELGGYRSVETPGVAVRVARRRARGRARLGLRLPGGDDPEGRVGRSCCGRAGTRADQPPTKPATTATTTTTTTRALRMTGRMDVGISHIN